MGRKLTFENQQIYHILNRGIDKRIIFQDEVDYYRFIFLIYACNVGSPALNLWRNDIVKAGQAILAGENPPRRFIQNEHKQLVEVLTASLLPNHFHSVLEQKIERGISVFMQKIGTAYTKYFNLRHKRVGRLFQGPFGAILVNDENYLLRLSRYIHLNPLDLIFPAWREEKVKDWNEAMRFLINYPWSSLPDYLGVRNSNLITAKGLYNEFFENFNKKGKVDYQKFLMGWPEENMREIHPYLLE